MTAGIFFVNFSVGPNNIGHGLITISNGCINGGDESYLYQGHLDVYGGQAKVSVHITHYRGPLNSVFGALQSYTLNLSGTADEKNFNVQGCIAGTASPVIQILGRKVAPLYERTV